MNEKYEKLEREVDDRLSALSLTNKHIEDMFDTFSNKCSKELVMKIAIIDLAESLDISQTMCQHYRIVNNSLSKLGAVLKHLLGREDLTQDIFLETIEPVISKEMPIIEHLMKVIEKTESDNGNKKG